MSLRERSKRGQAAANVADVPSGTSHGTDLGDAGKTRPGQDRHLQQFAQRVGIETIDPVDTDDGRPAATKGSWGEVATDGCVLTEPIVLSRRSGGTHASFPCDRDV